MGCVGRRGERRKKMKNGEGHKRHPISLRVVNERSLRLQHRPPTISVLSLSSPVHARTHTQTHTYTKSRLVPEENRLIISRNCFHMFFSFLKIIFYLTLRTHTRSHTLIATQREPFVVCTRKKYANA